jgi:propanol-preferring alcohol dehydrogenase
MRALILERQAEAELRPLKLTESPTPRPKVGEALIRIAACGVCRTDLHIVEGDLPLRASPIIPGHQIVGIVEGIGRDVDDLSEGQRVGVAWLGSTCGNCHYCADDRENLCEFAEFTGWTRNGGFAEFVTASAGFIYPLPENFQDFQAAPLLCAGIIGYRALRLTGIESWSGAKLGIFGFGAAGHVCIQIARARGADVYVATRDREKHQTLAEDLGAVWVGDTFDMPPEQLDASIIFAPAGEIVPVALKSLSKGATLVLGGIHMSPIPQIPYELIYGERVVRSVANNTRQDGLEFLAEAASIQVRTSVQQFGLADANEALIALKRDAIRGAAVLAVSG